MDKTTVTVSFYGTNEDVLALKAIAAARGLTFGKFMRWIADQQLGSEIEAMKNRQALFFKQDAQSTEHYSNKVSKAK